MCIRAHDGVRMPQGDGNDSNYSMRQNERIRIRAMECSGDIAFALESPASGDLLSRGSVELYLLLGKSE